MKINLPFSLGEFSCFQCYLTVSLISTHIKILIFRRNGYQYEKLGSAGRGGEMQNLSIGGGGGGGGVQNQIELQER